MKHLFTITVVCIIFLTSCVDKEKLKQEAFSEGFEKGQKTKYTELVNKYYSDSTILRLSNSDYKHNLDTREQVEKLTSQSKEEFQNVVYALNQDILSGLSYKLNLTESQKQKIFEVYSKSHRTISNEYYSQYTQLCNKKELNRRPDEFIRYTYYDRTEALAEVMGSQLCSTIGFIIGTLNIEYPAGNIAGILAGTPCVVISTQLLKPITDDLLESGFIKDITASKGTIEKKLSNMIVELATIEKQYNTKLNVTNEVKTFWGLFTSTADVTAEYYGIVKAGYNLGNNFQLQIDYSAQRILIITDEPKIFDPVVYPKITNMQNGWFAKIDENTLNGMQVRATNQIVNTALSDNILSEATRNAKYFLYNVFEPIAKIPPKPFSVDIISRSEMNELKMNLKK